MKKVFVLLMTVVMLVATMSTAFAAGSPTPEEVTFEKPEAVKTEDGTELKAEDVKVDSVDLVSLSKDKPAVVETITATKEAVAKLTETVKAEPAKKAEAVNTYFKEKGEEVVKAVEAAIKASTAVQSVADIEPVVVEKPIEVAMKGESLEAVKKEFAAGKTVEMTLPIPTAFAVYDLKEDSFLCAELIDENGQVHIVTFQIVNGKMVGKFPALGHISNFWVGSNAAADVKAPQTGNVNLEGVMVCGAALCVVALLFSVKRFKLV